MKVARMWGGIIIIAGPLLELLRWSFWLFLRKNWTLLLIVVVVVVIVTMVFVMVIGGLMSCAVHFTD